MYKLKSLLLLSIVVTLVGCYDAPIAPESQATIDDRLLGRWDRTDVAKHPKNKLDRIVLPPWAEFKKHGKNPKRYLVNSVGTTNKPKTNEGYSVKYKEKTFLVFWLKMKPNEPPVAYKVWYVDFIKPNEAKVYSLRLPNRKTVKTSAEFQKRFDQHGEKSYFYEATYKKK
jgi:hypothetical protein